MSQKKSYKQVINFLNARDFDGLRRFIESLSPTEAAASVLRATSLTGMDNEILAELERHKT